MNPISMSKKKILALVIITIIAIIGVVGAMAYSFKDSNVTIANSTLTKNISKGTLSYKGSVVLEQVIYIYNSGTLDIQNLLVNIKVYFSGNLNPTEVMVGQGTNNLGNVAAGMNVSKTLRINLTEYIPRLAVENGKLRIVIDSSLQLQLVPYQISLPQQVSTETWNAPFTP